MGYFRFFLLLASILFPTIAGASCIHQVPDDAMVPRSSAPQGNFRIGGRAENFYACSGARISKIVVWLHPGEVRGLDITFSGYDEEGLFSERHVSNLGSPQGTKRVFEFEHDELIQSMTLYGNGKPNQPRLGGMTFKTTKDRSFDVKIGGSGLGKYPVDVGSGFPMGWSANHGDAIDQFAMRFFKRPQRQTVAINNYPNLTDIEPQLQTVRSSCVTLEPNDETTIAFNEAVKKSKGGKFSIALGLKVGLQNKLKGGIPGIAEGEATVSVEGSFSLSNDWTWSEERTWANTVTKKFPVDYYEQWVSGHTLGEISNLKRDTEGRPILFIKASQESYVATIDTPFEGSVSMEFGNGIEFSYPIRGTYEGVDFTDSRLALEVVGRCG